MSKVIFQTFTSLVAIACLHGAATGEPLLVQADGVDKPAAAPANAADAPAPAPKITFDFQPNSISMNSNINFDEQGNVNHASSNMSIGVRVRYKAKFQPVMVRNIKYTKVTTDTLENLTPVSQSSDQTLYSWENANNNNRQDMFYMSMSFNAPVSSAKKITEMSGTMDVVTPQGEVSEAVLKPFSDYENKRITFKNLPGMFIIFTRESINRRGNDQARLKVEMSKDMRPYIDRIVLTDNAGRELRYSGWGGGSNNSTEYRQLNIDVPDDGTIRLQIYPRVDTITVPFQIRDMPLVKPGEEAKPGDVMVELKPIAPADGELTLERLTPVVDQ